MVLLFETVLIATHLMGVASWVGGNLFLHLVLNPRLKSIPPGAARVLSGGVGRRNTYVSWISLAAIASTGLVIAWNHGLLSLTVLLQTNAGYVLMLLIAVTLIAVLHGLLITVVAYVKMPRLAKKLGPATVSSEQFKDMNESIDFLAIANVFWGIIALILGVILAQGI